MVIGVRGPLAPPEACNGLAIPVVAFDQLYFFDREVLLDAIPRPDDVPAKEDERFRATAADLFDQILQMAVNAGATDEHRALNYLAVRYPAIYARATAALRQCLGEGDQCPPITADRGPQDRRRHLFLYPPADRRHRQVLPLVDVTEEFPFMITKLSPYYER
jgi:PatG C-terminal